MAHPVLWPKKTFFYPIGNTSAVNLAQDLTLEEPANLLLLGCGDPRNILYTIYSASSAFPRRHDFTCCDLEPAVLARNVVLLTFVVDGKSALDAWNIFFHFRIDKSSLSLLEIHCQELFEASRTPETWAKSKYGSYLKFCTSRTLVELRRHWKLYAEMQKISPKRSEGLLDDFSRGSKSVLDQYSSNVSGARSGGPTSMLAMELSPELFQHYWKTGTTFVAPEALAAVTYINPMFAYSAIGEGFNVHYGTNPLSPFHLAPAFAAVQKATISSVIAVAQSQFHSWCDTFKASVSPTYARSTIVRLHLGDALAFCQALRHCAVQHAAETPIQTTPWNTSSIIFDKSYSSGSSPTVFNVIDTSNLTDHLGVLNILISATPLLSKTPSAALYTETMLASGEDATAGFTKRLCADVSSLSLMLRLAPVQFLSKFSTHSNVHEVLLYRMSENSSQFHERITWKDPVGDMVAKNNLDQGPSPDPSQFGSWLFGVYLRMFANEDVRSMMQDFSIDMINERSLLHYTRESLVLLMKLMKERVVVDWEQTMNRFLDLLNADTTLLIGTNNYQDLCCQFHLHGIHSVPPYSLVLQPVGRFRHWESIPPIVRAILVIPRDSPKLKKLEEMTPDEIGTPMLQCEIRGAFVQNIFSSIRIGFGAVTASGNPRDPKVVFTEDPAGWSGNSSLVVSFLLPAWLLVNDPDGTSVSLSVRSTPTASVLMKILGLELNIFSARLMDEKLVHVVPDASLDSFPKAGDAGRPMVPRGYAIGKPVPVEVKFNDDCRSVSTLAAKVNIEGAKAKAELSRGGSVKAEQISPCAMMLKLGDKLKQEIAFPYPIADTAPKLRIARKSFYIEIVVPISGALLPGGYSLNPFPVLIHDKMTYPWNIHHLNLGSLPVLDTSKPSDLDWVNTHVSLAFSDRERTIRAHAISTDVFTNLKDSFHTIFIRFIGSERPKLRSFALMNSTNNIDTLLLINDIRFDVSSHTVVADGYVLPLTRRIVDRTIGALTRLQSSGKLVQVPLFGDEQRAWKQLLPALVERCRQWKHSECCEYVLQGRVPLTLEVESVSICTCGRGKDLAAFKKHKEWEGFAPYVTRIALSPLFAVSYLESVAGDLGHSAETRRRGGAVASGTSVSKMCQKCGGAGKPKILMCSGCRKVGYCSPTCQKGDWKAHKGQCKRF